VRLAFDARATPRADRGLFGRRAMEPLRSKVFSKPGLQRIRPHGYF
jgi:hypothetical protein